MLDLGWARVPYIRYLASFNDFSGGGRDIVLCQFVTLMLDLHRRLL